MSIAQLWDTPEPLDNFARPPFPVDALPPILANYVEALATETCTPPDLAGMLVLAAVGLLCAYKVEWSAPWREPVNLFVVSALPPGERKSPVFTKVFAPIEAIEEEKVKATADDRNAKNAERNLRIKFARKRAADALKEQDEPGFLVAEKERIEAEATPKPVAPQYLAADVTPEAIVGLLVDQGDRIGITSDEGGIFATLAGRYSQGVANLDAILKAHDGSSPIRVDRVGRPSQFVRKPTLTLALAVQPEILHQIGSNGEFAGRGLLARVLWSVPDSNIGNRPVDAPSIPDEVTAAYWGCLKGLDGTDEMRLQPSTPALRLFTKFRSEIETRQRPNGDLAGIPAWANKHAGAILRIAGGLHLAEHGASADECVSADTMRQALKLSPYLISHARIALDALGMREDYATARRVLAWVRSERSLTFTQRDASHDLRIQVEPLALGLDLLEDHGYLRRSKMKTGGRPSVRCEVWPGLLTPATGSDQEEAASAA